MSKRRRRGTGTIMKGRNGEFRARFPFQTGSREEIDGSPFPSYAAAEKALNAVLTALQDNGIAHGGITLKKLGEKALAQRDLDGYRSVDSEYDVWELRVGKWDRYHMPASSTTRGDVKAWLASMRNAKTKKPLATQTRRNALNLLRAVFAFGVDNELVSENPCDGIKVKDHGRTNDGSTYLTAQEVELLLSVATDPAVALKVGTGMRSGELRSLQWEDVHENHITVRFGSPERPNKNGKVREIPILPIAAQALAKLRTSDTMTGIVLPTVTGCYRKKGHVFDRNEWKAWLTAAKLTRRVRPHDLRHTCATLLLSGAWGDPWSYEAVKEMLGHSSVKVTERYARATGTLAQKAAMTMHRIPEGSQILSSEMAQAREILERRGSDSNRRVTVLQTQSRPHDLPVGTDIWGLWRAFVEAVANGDPTALAKGLRFADALAATAERRSA